MRCGSWVTRVSLRSSPGQSGAGVRGPRDRGTPEEMCGLPFTHSF